MATNRTPDTCKRTTVNNKNKEIKKIKFDIEYQDRQLVILRNELDALFKYLGLGCYRQSNVYVAKKIKRQCL